ncbi:type I-F CRISPR-associated endoribonuclease Cas6/Csy4, partial [Pseudomonas aeruginosa]|uniref:type I-F CRISPR-associated endoribonuclease Cas6/Csy4 n=1 Tax=Pseudomonas aeruginosa TaxID=287 RepID=UPI00396AA6A5
MDHYLDIRLRPDPEFPPAQLMSVLFGKLHQALVAQGGDRIGVSFPDLDESRSRLGERLRIHAPTPTNWRWCWTTPGRASPT